MTLFKRDDGQEKKMLMHKIGDDRVASFGSFPEAVDYLHRLHGGERHAAMSAAARRYPDLHRRFNEDGIDIAKRAAEAAASRPVAKAVEVFEEHVDAVQARDRCARHEALSKARAEYPAAFEAYRTA